MDGLGMFGWRKKGDVYLPELGESPIEIYSNSLNPKQPLF